MGYQQAGPLGRCHQSLPWAGEAFTGVSLLKFPAVCSDGVEMELLGVLVPPGVFRAVILLPVY